MESNADVTGIMGHHRPARQRFLGIHHAAHLFTYVHEWYVQCNTLVYHRNAHLVTH